MCYFCANLLFYGQNIMYFIGSIKCLKIYFFKTTHKLNSIVAKFIAIIKIRN